MFATRLRALRRRTGRRRGRRPSRDVPAGAGGDRRRVRGARAADSTPRRRSTARTRRSTPTATCSATSASCAATKPTVGDRGRRGHYEIGMQDQAFLGLEAALAMPDPGGGGRRAATSPRSGCTRTASRSPACLDLPEEQVRLVLGGVGGAFGAREDISLQVHTCLLALRTGRPVRMQYSRAESFLGHVHRHPATIWMRHHATARRRDRQDRGAVRARRRRLRVDLVGGAAQRDHAHAGPVPVRQRGRRRLGGAHQPPAVRGDARLRRRAGVLRPRVPDRPAGRRRAGSTPSRSGCATRSAPATG